ncbi:MAG TPA: pyridoxamine 5'-phosphate oxidase [Opitutales bacterium]|nr:pyridoxamine 5'-phosphate oxidase [Opitutales bacterium]
MPPDSAPLNLNSLRRQSASTGLAHTDLDAQPWRQLEHWIADAYNAGIVEPNAMALATVGIDQQPHLRHVLLRGLDEQGLIFFTNYNSRKGHDIQNTPQATVLFGWHKLERQVEAGGTVEKLDKTLSDKYFQERPRDSQIAAWASPQSQVVQSRAELDHAYLSMQGQFEGHSIPRPPHWGGYRLRPNYWEFWQGRAHRLHDLFRYTGHQKAWTLERLSP